MRLTAYLSGEIHSDWREQIIAECVEEGVPVDFLSPVTDHEASDNVGTDILGDEEKNFWKDHKSAKINTIRIKSSIERADIVIVKFGEKYKQWNAAFDAGYAVAKGKPLITLHSEELIHPLKEINAQALASAKTPMEVVKILSYVTEKE